MSETLCTSKGEPLLALEAKVKVEDIIDLDQFKSKEEVVFEWYAEAKVTFLSHSAAESEQELIALMQWYIQILKEEASEFKDYKNLKISIEKHISCFQWHFKELNCCFVDNYFENMEEILSFYVNLVIKSLPSKAMNSNKRDYRNSISRIFHEIIQKLNIYLMYRDDHMCHVIMKLKFNSELEQTKDLLNLLYKHFVIKEKNNYSDLEFCRVYILCQIWKAIRKEDDWKIMDKMMYSLYERTPDSIKQNPVLSKILLPQNSSVLDVLINATKNNTTLIVEEYFRYIKSSKIEEDNSMCGIGHVEMEDDDNSDIICEGEDPETEDGYRKYLKEIAAVKFVEEADVILIESDSEDDSINIQHEVENQEDLLSEKVDEVDDVIFCNESNSQRDECYKQTLPFPESNKISARIATSSGSQGVIDTWKSPVVEISDTTSCSSPKQPVQIELQTIVEDRCKNVVDKLEVISSKESNSQRDKCYKQTASYLESDNIPSSIATSPGSQAAIDTCHLPVVEMYDTTICSSPKQSIQVESQAIVKDPYKNIVEKLEVISCNESNSQRDDCYKQTLSFPESNKLSPSIATSSGSQGVTDTGHSPVVEVSDTTSCSSPKQSIPVESQAIMEDRCKNIVEKMEVISCKESNSQRDKCYKQTASYVESNKLPASIATSPGFQAAIDTRHLLAVEMPDTTFCSSPKQSVQEKSQEIMEDGCKNIVEKMKVISCEESNSQRDDCYKQTLSFPESNKISASIATSSGSQEVIDTWKLPVVEMSDTTSCSSSKQSVQVESQAIIEDRCKNIVEKMEVISCKESNSQRDKCYTQTASYLESNKLPASITTSPGSQAAIDTRHLLVVEMADTTFCSSPKLSVQVESQAIMEDRCKNIVEKMKVISCEESNSQRDKCYKPTTSYPELNKIPASILTSPGSQTAIDTRHLLVVETPDTTFCSLPKQSVQVESQAIVEDRCKNIVEKLEVISCEKSNFQRDKCYKQTVSYPELNKIPASILTSPGSQAAIDTRHLLVLETSDTSICSSPRQFIQVESQEIVEDRYKNTIENMEVISCKEINSQRDTCYKQTASYSELNKISASILTSPGSQAPIDTLNLLVMETPDTTFCSFPKLPVQVESQAIMVSSSQRDSRLEAKLQRQTTASDSSGWNKVSYSEAENYGTECDPGGNKTKNVTTGSQKSIEIPGILTPPSERIFEDTNSEVPDSVHKSPVYASLPYNPGNQEHCLSLSSGMDDKPNYCSFRKQAVVKGRTKEERKRKANAEAPITFIKEGTKEKRKRQSCAVAPITVVKESNKEKRMRKASKHHNSMRNRHGSDDAETNGIENNKNYTVIDFVGDIIGDVRSLEEEKQLDAMYFLEQRKHTNTDIGQYGNHIPQVVASNEDIQQIFNREDLYKEKFMKKDALSAHGIPADSNDSEKLAEISRNNRSYSDILDFKIETCNSFTGGENSFNSYRNFGNMWSTSPYSVRDYVTSNNSVTSSSFEMVVPQKKILKHARKKFQSNAGSDKKTVLKKVQLMINPEDHALTKREQTQLSLQGINNKSPDLYNVMSDSKLKMDCRVVLAPLSERDIEKTMRHSDYVAEVEKEEEEQKQAYNSVRVDYAPPNSSTSATTQSFPYLIYTDKKTAKRKVQWALSVDEKISKSGQGAFNVNHNDLKRRQGAFNVNHKDLKRRRVSRAAPEETIEDSGIRKTSRRRRKPDKDYEAIINSKRQ